MSAKVIFSNKPSEINAKLINFFKTNLLNLLKTNLVFQFVVATENDAAEYSSQGIEEFPVLLKDNIRVTGLTKITKFLGLHVKKHNARIASKSDDDYVRDYWKETLGEVKIDDSGKIVGDDDEDEEEDLGRDLQHKIQEAFDQREQFGKPPKKKTQMPNVGLRKNNLEESPTETIVRMAQDGSANQDDLLMAKLFENQEDSCA